MAIMVHLKDDTVCFVPDRDLVDLILSDSIVAFRRGTVWVNLAVASIKRPGAFARKSARDKSGAAARVDIWKRIMITDTR